MADRGAYSAPRSTGGNPRWAATFETEWPTLFTAASNCSRETPSLFVQYLTSCSSLRLMRERSCGPRFLGSSGMASSSGFPCERQRRALVSGHPCQRRAARGKSNYAERAMADLV